MWVSGTAGTLTAEVSRSWASWKMNSTTWPSCTLPRQWPSFHRQASMGAWHRLQWMSPVGHQPMENLPSTDCSAACTAHGTVRRAV